MRDWPSRIQEFVEGIAASVAVVGRDDAGGFVIVACNDGFMEMTGGRYAGVRDFPLPFDAMVPSYARREFREMLLDCFGSGVARELEQAYDLKDGTHWWRLSLKPLLHTLGNSEIVEILVTGIDITPKMQLTRELEISTSRFRSVVDAAYDAIITIDQNHTITLFNRAAENLFGYQQSEMIGQQLDRLMPSRFHAIHHEYVSQFLRSPVASRQMDERNRIYGQHADGSLVPVEIAISKINVDGLVEFTAVIRDIADRIHLMDLLQKQAVTDELTGLPNRRAFIDAVLDMLRFHEHVSLFILDVDHFKSINDTHGHDAGDDVLRALAAVGKAYLRQDQVFARLGGEEFVAAMPDMELEDARAFADALRATIEASSFTHGWRSEVPLPFTVSIGIATRRPGEQEVGTILRRADQALYRAKTRGRNRVETEAAEADDE
ncbi:sensor domain-containing diguanylate cyclase [Xanthobacter sediminis]